jgi:hypothetical protein
MIQALILGETVRERYNAKRLGIVIEVSASGMTAVVAFESEERVVRASEVRPIAKGNV